MQDENSGKIKVLNTSKQSIKVSTLGSKKETLTNLLTYLPTYFKKAFTLAEVLIILGIIGIVAALTIPSLITTYQEKVTVAKLKKTYNLLSIAFLQAKSENGDVYTFLDSYSSTEHSIEGANAVMEYIRPYIKISDECIGDCKNFTEKLFHLNGKASLDGFNSIFKKLRLSDGTTLYFRIIGCNRLSPVCGDIFIDTNGKKEPNALGKDIFNFQIRENSTITADGIGEDPSNNGWAYCNPNSQGWYCTAWVIYKENMDYLRCADELTWDGKNKCK